MPPFRWKNCFADVQTSKHDLTIQTYFEDVVLPAIATLEAKIEALGRSEHPGDAFAQSDMEDVLQESNLAFGLAIQSIWERQLRSYLLGCASELHPEENLAPRIEKADWAGLAKLFRRLRGIALDAFPSFPELDLLQELGNACRHGDGKSAVRLYERLPIFGQSFHQRRPSLMLRLRGPHQSLS